MRVSYNWLKKYLPVSIPVEEIAAILTSLGLEVSSIEHVESIKGGLNGVVAGKIISCIKHPNADRLSVTTVNVGTGSLLQIVCGASNVAQGQTVWVATVGTTLYPLQGEQALNIAKAKVRGEISEGMICAEDELGLSSDHSGIMVLPDNVEIGTKANVYYEVTSDDVLEIELTPNRSDAISHLGIARDIAAWFKVNKGPVALSLPQIPNTVERTADYQIDVEVKNHEACPRYCGVTITGIKIGSSPKWLQDALRAIGVRPISNIVDITNFVLHEMGQPLHAFDADKVKRNKVIVQTLPPGSLFTTLDQVERKLSSEDLMICDGENHGMCIAGVYGGIGSGISDTTTNIFLESAHFHPQWIRRTSMRHDLRTDAARTFEKTTDPNISKDALLRAVDLILQLAGGQVASEIIDIYPQPIQPRNVEVRWEMINKLIGVEMSSQKVTQILEALNMTIVKSDDQIVMVSVPTDKADVTREADVIEEILRIYGFDNVEMKPKLEIALTTARRSMNTLRDDLGNFLAGHGFLEMMGLSLIESRQYENGPLQIADNARVLIANTSNVHLDLMRHNLLASALDAVRFNQNRMQSDLMLYEFGRTYQRCNGEILEDERLTLSLCGSPVQSGWRNKSAEADFYSMKKYVHLVLDHLGITPDNTSELDHLQWEYALEYQSGKKPIVTFGKINRAVMQQYDVKTSLFFADFDMSAMLSLSAVVKFAVQEIPKFPAVLRDIAIVISDQVPYGQVEAIIMKAAGQLLTDCSLFDIYENAETLGAGKRSLAISLRFQDPTRTLNEADVSKTLQQIVSALQKETGATLR